MPSLRPPSLLTLTSHTIRFLGARRYPPHPSLRPTIPLNIRPTIRTHSSMAPHPVPPLKDPSLLKSQSYINGTWLSPPGSSTFPVTDPATNLPISSCPDLTAADAQNAITAATAALPSYRALTGRARSHLLRQWHDAVLANAEDLATLITWENGKPLAEARGEIAYAASFLEWFSEEAPRVYGDTIPATTAQNRIFTLKEPVGVCALITPWNFPAAMVTRKLGPALAAGCTVVAKAPAETPLTMLALAELADRAGIPPGVVNVITTSTHTAAVGEALMADPRVRKVSFTGSTAVGQLLMRQAGGTLKKCSFELGGNAPFIVFDDARDLDKVVDGAVASKFRSSGQTCVCANRIYVQRGVYEAFAEKFVARVKAFTVGSGYEEGVTHGPLIHERAIGKVVQHVKDAEEKGARVLHGGQQLANLGPNFFEPTVLGDMTGEMRIASEETFGPVGALFPFDTEQEVIELANKAEVGLAGYFYSSNLERVWRVAEALEVGMIGVNTGMISDAAAPFGGVKFSGFGREGSKYGIDEYLITKTVTIGGIGGLRG